MESLLLQYGTVFGTKSFARDRLGVKPLFYSKVDDVLVFGSEPKALLQHPKVQPIVGPEGLAEIFIIGPARTPGHGVYKDMQELRPGHAMIYSREGLRSYAYWKLESAKHTDNEAETAAKVRELLQDTLERQLVSDVPVCSLLSGGLDSSALTALAVDYYNRNGQGQVDTYSVDYVDNDKHFKSHTFQPGADGPWIKRMVDELNTNHHYISFDTPELVEALDNALYTRDLPGMTDVDSSLYLFCREIKKNATVAISGEAADEIFGDTLGSTVRKCSPQALFLGQLLRKCVQVYFPQKLTSGFVHWNIWVTDIVMRWLKFRSWMEKQENKHKCA